MKKVLLLITLTIILSQTSLFGSDYRNINSNHSAAATVNQLISALSNQLTQNKDFINIEESKIAITSFVCLDNFKSVSRLSNILSENLIHEMQVRGYKIIDFKTMNNIHIDNKGDFLFSRDISKLRTDLNIDYALTGTYVKYKSGIVVNARIVDLKTHIVYSSAQIFIPKRVIKRIIPTGNHIPSFTPHHVVLAK